MGTDAAQSVKWNLTTLAHITEEQKLALVFIQTTRFGITMSTTVAIM